MSDGMFYLCGFLLIVLFYGEPDIWDRIMAILDAHRAALTCVKP